MSQVAPPGLPIEPPPGEAVLDRPGEWLAVPLDDPVAAYLAAELWDRPEQPASWEIARLSAAAHIYRETATGWSVVVKFYAAKTGSGAQKYATREYEYTRQARAAGLDGERMRAVRPLALWRGLLFLEHVEGLTLEDAVAIRRSQPGRLLPALEQTARFLARLHAGGMRPGEMADFDSPAADLNKVIRNLAEHGVLQDVPVVRDGLVRLVDTRWVANPAMRDFVPAFSHGDATTTNFIFPWEGGIVGIDWERAKVADPAADVGRLMAEVAHSVTRYGGTFAEGAALVDHLCAVYCEAGADYCDGEQFAGRARFYRAYSTLRIARNGWLSRLERMTLVAQALALLA